MFGYVRVNKPELKVKEYELYRSTYCGLCRSMGKCTGQCSRMTLSYDFAFLALVRTALLSEEISFDKKRCIAHPLQKRTYMKNNPTLEYCSGAAALLNYHKIKDDLSDEKGAKKWRARLLLPFVAYSRKKALKRGLSELDKKIAERLSELDATEKKGESSVNRPATVFGELLGDIVSYRLDSSRARVGYSLGLAVGKWIYIADALDDWEEDGKRGRYNPFISLYSKDRPSDDDIEGIKTALKNELYSAEAAFDLIEFENEEIKNILANILYLGLPNKIETIANERYGKSCKCDKKRPEDIGETESERITDK